MAAQTVCRSATEGGSAAGRAASSVCMPAPMPARNWTTTSSLDAKYRKNVRLETPAAAAIASTVTASNPSRAIN